MLELPDVTLVCVDARETALALAAIEQSIARCRFADVLFVTGEPVALDDIRVIHRAELRDDNGISRFVANDLAGIIGSSHALLIGWDAFVAWPEAWGDDFLHFDFIAPAVRSVAEDNAALPTEQPASTGIALLSRHLLERLHEVPMVEGGDLLDALRADAPARSVLPQPLTRAPREVADRFAFAHSPPAGRSIGFEGLWNMWMVFQPRDLESFIGMASPAVLGSRDAMSLAINLRNLGRINEATMLMRAIAGADPANLLVRQLQNALADPVTSVSAGRAPGAVGRNDPCPCGSRKRFKSCHGAIVATGPGNSPIRVQQTRPITDSDELATFWNASDGRVAVFLHRARDAFQRRDAACVDLYRNVLEGDPNNAEATSYLGVIATRNQQLEVAEKLLTAAIDLAPLAAEYRTNLGILQQTRGDYPAAVESYREAIRLDPGDAPAHNNLGLVLQELGQPHAAIASFRNAVAALPAFAEAHWNLAVALILTGDFEEGLAEHEWRFQSSKLRELWQRRRWFPQWNGEPLAGKRLLILAEQGFGDMIQYIRYAAILAEQGASIVLEASAEMTALMHSTRGIEMIAPSGGPFPPCDYQIVLMSLPFALKTRCDSIPAPVPYISADPARSQRFQALFGEKRKPRIGIAWCGNPGHVRDRERSLPLAMLLPLLVREDIEWVSLQKGPDRADVLQLPAGIALSTLIDQARDFADTAALIMELDLVISVDTSVAHLAGALGAETLTLLDSAADARWLLQRADSPWYPTMRLLRQRTRGDWSDVVRAAEAEVERRFGRAH